MVRDNGAGISHDKLTEINEQFHTSIYKQSDTDKPEGIGLGNINERLKLFYGEEYPIRISSMEGHYTETVFMFPYDTGEGDEENYVQSTHY
ncbi:Histidine kinase-, DNA gyrase B-, and HSP90-like ATPase [compost metagenome]